MTSSMKRARAVTNISTLTVATAPGARRGRQNQLAKNLIAIAKIPLTAANATVIVNDATQPITANCPMVTLQRSFTLLIREVSVGGSNGLTIECS